MPFSYTMEHSFCGPIREKHHFNASHYSNIGKGIAITLNKYYRRNYSKDPFKELYASKELMQVGAREDEDSS